MYLNYAIALYNDGDVKGAAVQYRKYQSKSRSLDEEEDPDPEVLNTHTCTMVEGQAGCTSYCVYSVFQFLFFTVTLLDTRS